MYYLIMLIYVETNLVENVDVDTGVNE